MNVWQPACRPGPSGWGGWREMQSVRRLGGIRAKAAHPAHRGAVLGSAVHPCCGMAGALLRAALRRPCRGWDSGEGCTLRALRCTLSDGHRTWDGDVSCGSLGPR